MILILMKMMMMMMIMIIIIKNSNSNNNNKKIMKTKSKISFDNSLILSDNEFRVITLLLRFSRPFHQYTFSV